MKRTIYRFGIPYLQTTDAIVDLPKGSTVVFVKAEKQPNEVVSIWVEVDLDTTDRELKKWRLIGTGHPVPERAIYRGTAVEDGPGRLVLHLYELS